MVLWLFRRSSCRCWEVLASRHEHFHRNVSVRTICSKIYLRSLAQDNNVDYSFFYLKLGFAACTIGIVAQQRQSVACKERDELHDLNARPPLTPKDLESLILRLQGEGKSSPLRLMPLDLEYLSAPSASNPEPVPLPPPMPGLAGRWSKSRNVALIFGLPYLGKQFVARKLQNYVGFFHGAYVEIFDIMDYTGPGGDAKLLKALKKFFDANVTNDQERGGFAIITTHDTVESTSSHWSAHTKSNRRWVMQELRDNLDAVPWFIQITVDDNKDVDDFMAKLARKRGKTLEEVRATIEDFKDNYVPLEVDGSEADLPSIELINYREAMILNKLQSVIQSYIGARICRFLSNLHPYQHTVYLSSNGESEYEVQQRIGGDSSLTLVGREYARRLGEFSKFVVSGKATDLVCVTLKPDEIEKLPAHLTRFPSRFNSERGLYARSDWHDFGNASGGTVLDSMRLVRLQLEFGEDFVDAPFVLADLIAMIRGRSATLVFVSGEAAGAETIPARLWTSTLARARETAQFIPHASITGPGGKSWKQMRDRIDRNLDELSAGSCDGRTIQDIRERDPQILEDWGRDKFGFRFPKGESYYDVIWRVDDLCTYLESFAEPLLIISHRRVLRLIISWLTELSRKESLKFTAFDRLLQHSVVKISFDGLEDPSITVYPLGPVGVMNSVAVDS